MAQNLRICNREVNARAPHYPRSLEGFLGHNFNVELTALC